MPEPFVYRVRPEHRSGRGTYWRANAAGYTDDLAQAGRFPNGDRVRDCETAEAVLLTDEQARLNAPSVFTAKVRERVPTFSHSEADLLRWVCKHPRPGEGRAVRWSHVAETLGVGSTTAHAICLALDLDPDEHIGEAHEDEGVSDG